MLACRKRLYAARITSCHCFASCESLRVVTVHTIDACIVLVVLVALYGLSYLAGAVPICPVLPGASAFCWFFIGPLLGLFIVAFFFSLVVAWTWVFRYLVNAAGRRFEWGECCTEYYWHESSNSDDGGEEEEDIVLSDTDSHESI